MGNGKKGIVQKTSVQKPKKRRWRDDERKACFGVPKKNSENSHAFINIQNGAPSIYELGYIITPKNGLNKWVEAFFITSIVMTLLA